MFNMENKLVYIYGYNESFGRQKKLVSWIKSINLDLEGIIDNKKCNDCDIISYKSFLYNTRDKKDTCVVVLNFSSVKTHGIVSKKLFEDGYNNIIFLPDIMDKYSYYENKMRRVYNYISYQEISDSFMIPTYNEIVNDKTIFRYKNDVVFWYPISELYLSEMRGDEDVDSTYRYSDFSEKKVLDFVYYKELIDYVFAEGKIPEGYLANTLCGREQDLFLEDRKNLFRTFDCKLKYDFDFFLASPVITTWNWRTSKLHVLDGLHRIFYLHYRGYDFVPVIASNADYEMAERILT